MSIAANPKLRFEQPLPDITWLTDGSAQPDHLSVFVFNADPDNDEQEHTLAVPELVVGDGGTVEHCHVINFATAGLGVSLLSHPGLIIDHPLVRSGQAWELLHSPPASGADLAALSPRGYKSVGLVRGGGTQRGHRVDESSWSFLTGLFGFEVDPS